MSRVAATTNFRPWQRVRHKQDHRLGTIIRKGDGCSFVLWDDVQPTDCDYDIVVPSYKDSFLRPLSAMQPNLARDVASVYANAV